MSMERMMFIERKFNFPPVPDSIAAKQVFELHFNELASSHYNLKV